MARIRTIKPEFWSDDKISEVSRDARLLFIGIWNYADDYGNIERSSKQMKARIFPYDSDIDCEKLVKELINKDLLVEYSVNDSDYINVKGFRKHQRIDKPSKTRLPFPGEKIDRGDKQKAKSTPSPQNKTVEPPPVAITPQIPPDLPPPPADPPPPPPDPYEEPGSSLVITSIAKLKEEMMGEIFIEQSCIALHTDIETFRQFVVDWCEEKAATIDYFYPARKLKAYLLSDFKKQKRPISKTTNVNLKSAAELAKQMIFEEGGVV